MHAFNAMNTTITTLGLSEQARLQVESWFQFVESILSRFQADSELTALNRSNGQPFAASPLLYQVSALADEYHTQTDGLFNPYLGDVLRGLGYNRTFEQLTASPEALLSGTFVSGGQSGALASVGQSGGQYGAVGAGQLTERVPTASLRPITGESRLASPIMFDPATLSMTLSPGATVDLGGIAKGWSGDQICRFLRDDGIESGVIDAGGDLICWGEDATGLQVAITDPFIPDRDAVNLILTREAGIATSSTGKRRWTNADGAVRHHLIDPRTRTSSDSDLVQVTVLAPNVTTAEVYAKCVLLLGSEAGISWLAECQPELGVIGIRSDRSVVIGDAVQMYSAEGVAAHE